MNLYRKYYKYKSLIKNGLIISVCTSLLILLYDPVFLVNMLPVSDVDYDGEVQHDHKVVPLTFATPAIKDLSKARKTFNSFLDLPFMPKEFVCEDLMEQAGKQFSYSETYWDHADAYKSALQLNNILSTATTNEFSWMLQELARMPSVDTVCESSFDAGGNTFQWLVADETTIVHSFDKMNKNYSLEMADFMSIEFPESFFIHEGDQQKTIPEFVKTNEGKVTCDVIFIDTSKSDDVIRSNILNLRLLANAKNHLLVLDSHPDAHGREHAGKVWKEFIDRKQVTEHFKCHFNDKDEIGSADNGITIGTYNM